MKSRNNARVRRKLLTRVLDVINVLTVFVHRQSHCAVFTQLRIHMHFASLSIPRPHRMESVARHKPSARPSQCDDIDNIDDPRIVCISTQIALGPLGVLSPTVV